MWTRNGMLALSFVLATVPLVATQGTQSNGAGSGTLPTDFDSRWLPWIGCWQLWEEQVDREADQAAAFPDRTFVCVTPAETGPGVALTALSDDRVLIERAVVADAVPREVSDGDCAGLEQSEWASDGRRLFTRAEFHCGEDPVRSVAGISLMTTPSTWVDIQQVTVADRQHLEIRRYNSVSNTQRKNILGAAFAVPANSGDIQQARRESAAPLVLPSVMEATGKTAPRVVEAMLTETKPRFSLDSAALIKLDDTGLNHGVIDLLVALAYPDQFVVERRSQGGGWSSGGGLSSARSYDPIWRGDLYPYYATPFGYSAWSSMYSPYLYGGLASPFIMLQTNDAEVPAGQSSEGTGYTRFRRVAGGGVTRSGGTSGGGAVTRSGGGASSGGSSSGRVSGGGVTRSGGGTSGGGRTAVPRR